MCDKKDFIFFLVDFSTKPIDVPKNEFKTFAMTEQNKTQFQFIEYIEMEEKC